jgi:hypothetical protein
MLMKVRSALYPQSRTNTKTVHSKDDDVLLVSLEVSLAWPRAHVLVVTLPPYKETKMDK